MRGLLFGLTLAAASGAFAQSAAPGNVERGRKIVESSGCTGCHRIAGKGKYAGIDLSEIGFRRSADQLMKDITEPAAEVQPQNRLYRVVTREGATVTGKILNQDQYSVQMIDDKDRLVAFQKSGLKEFGFIATPPMPSYKGKLAPQELADAVAYLASLRGLSK
jgi:putative heme-binding domain-containing protein